MKRVEIDGPDERLVDALIEAGLCKDANEVVHVALDMFRQSREEKLAALKAGIELGMEDARNGNIIIPKSVEETKIRFRELLNREN